MMDTPTTQINFPPPQSTDHDLLLTIKAEMGTKLDRVINDVKDLSDNFASRVRDLENEKLSVADFEAYKKDHATDFENYKYNAVNTLAEAKQDQDSVNTDVKDNLKFLNRYVWMALGALALLNLYFVYKQTNF